MNEYVELTGEAFVGYENIKEYKESEKELKDEKDIQDLVKDKVTRKDAYKKLKTVIDNNLKTTKEELDKAINSKN